MERVKTGVPRKFQCAIHRVHKVFGKVGEQEGTIVFYPVVAALSHVVVYALLTLLQVVRSFKILGPIPVTVGTSWQRMSGSAVILHA